MKTFASRNFLNTLLVLVLAQTCHFPVHAQVGPGKALAFDSAGSRMIGGPVSLPPPWTVELWVKRRDTDTPSAPLFVNATNALKLEQYGSNRQVGVTQFGVSDRVFAYTAPANEWTHLTFAANDSEICLFTNGTFHSCVPGSMSLPLDFFGSAPGRTNDQLRADVDEIRVWNREFIQVPDDIHRRLSGTEPGLVIYWRCDDLYGNAILNVSTNSLLPGAQLQQMGSVASGVPFAPEIGPDSFSGGTPNELILGSRLHAGNLPTTVRILAGNSLQVTNARPELPIPESETLKDIRYPFEIAPGARVVFGRFVASNALGVVESPVARAVVPAFNVSEIFAWTNECHAPLSPPPVRARMAPISIAAGIAHSLVLEADGSVLEWGADPDESYPPRSARNVAALAAFGQHRMALRTDGEVLSWGLTSAPTVPRAASPAVAIAAGFGHGLALRSDRTVVGWGRNSQRQLDVPSAATGIVAIAAGAQHSLALNSNGRVFAWGSASFGATAVPLSATSNVVAIAAGSDLSVALLADGTVRAWGDNRYRQLEIPPDVTNAVAIAAGFYHVMALLPGGRVRVWGQNDKGQCDVPTGLSNIVAIAAGGFHSLALLANGDVVAWGDNTFGQRNVPATDSRLVLPITLEPSGPPETTGRFPFLFLVTNSFGVFSRTSELQVIDTTPPTVTIRGNDHDRVFQHVPYLDPGVAVDDACDSAARVTTNGVVDVSRPGNFTLTYTARDAAGNVRTTSRLVTVEPWPWAPGDINGDGRVDQNELAGALERINGNGVLTPADVRMVLDRYYAHHAGLRMTNVVGLGGSHVAFSLDDGDGVAGQELQVEYSTNLVQWLPLGSTVPQYRFIDPGAGRTDSIRIYRLRRP